MGFPDDLVIVHYHLGPGGVTRVIEGHLRALGTLPAGQHPQRVHLLHGGSTDGWKSPRVPFDVRMHAIGGLAYDATPVDRSDSLAADIQAYFAREGIAADRAVIHAHNPTLGKNASMAGACRRLADAGYRFVLHPHDFAEDLRPENYRLLAASFSGVSKVPEHLYFHGPHVHWAVLTHRDREILTAAGIPADRVHWLPNPVPEAAPVATDRAQAKTQLARRLEWRGQKRYFLYPVRGIRRKNVGELLLLASLLREDAFFGMTLPPANPREQPVYAHWCRLAARMDLPVHLATSTIDGIDFDLQRSAADWLVTTSVAEGFGLVFLEGWGGGLPLAGRDLPDITRSFLTEGLALPALADRLEVPVEAVGRDAIVASLVRWDGHIRRALGFDPGSERESRRRVEGLVVHDRVDFAHLDLECQTRFLEWVAAAPARREVVRELNPLWERIAGGWTLPAEQVGANAAVVRERFGLEPCGRRLSRIYRIVHDGAPRPLERVAHPEAVLESFLRPDRLFPIRMA